MNFFFKIPNFPPKELGKISVGIANTEAVTIPIIIKITLADP